MNKTLKEMFDQNINKNTIYYQIQSNQRKKHLKYIIIPLCTLIILMLSISHFQPSSHKSSNTFLVYAYDENGQKQDLKVNPEIMLSQYNKSQSNVPGYPIKINIDEKKINTIELSINNGEIITWTQETGKVKYHGSSYFITKTKTIYLDLNADATLKLTMKKNNKIIAIQSIKFIQDSSYNLKVEPETKTIFIK